jgi:cytosine permease
MNIVPATGLAADEHAHSAIPPGERVAGWRVGLIVASFSIGLPDFLNAAQVGFALGLRMAVLAALVSGVFLCLGSTLTARTAVRTRMSTYALIERSFGRGGAMAINTTIALVHFCWFGVNASFFGEVVGGAADASGLHVGMSAVIVIGALLMAISTAIGFRALDRLASIGVPVLALLLGTVAVLAVHRHGLVIAPVPDAPVPLRFGIAVSALAGSNMLALTTMPDLARYIETPRGAGIAMALSFPVAAPIMMAVSATAALALHDTSLTAIVIKLGLSTPILFALVLPTFTVNALNLYSASLALSTTFPRFSRTVYVAFGAIVGTGLALGGIIDAFVPFLLLLGVVIPPIAAIYVIDNRRGVVRSRSDMIHWRAIAAWAIAVIAALAIEWSGRMLTTIPALDATLFAAATYYLLGLSDRTMVHHAT